MYSDIHGYIYKNFDQKTWFGTKYTNRATRFYTNIKTDAKKKILVVIKRARSPFKILILCVKTIFLCVILFKPLFFFFNNSFFVHSMCKRPNFKFSFFFMCKRFFICVIFNQNKVLIIHVITGISRTPFLELVGSFI